MNFRHKRTLIAGRRLVSGLVVPLLLILPACQPEVGDEPVTTAEPVGESEPVTPPALEEDTEQEADQPPPEETAYDPDIETVTAAELANLIEANEGKVTVVNFWATWCPPCVHEMPELAEFYENMDTEFTTFISASVDHPDTVEDAVVPFMNEHEIPFPVEVINGTPDDIIDAMDVGDWVGAVPGTFIYDQQGKLVKSWNQEITREDVEAAIEPLR